MPLFTGHGSRWIWWHATGVVLDDELEAACVELESFYKMQSEPCVGFNCMHELRLPNARQRRRLADIANCPGRRHLKGLATVIDSPLARGALTAISWLTKAPVPEASFAIAGDAFEWLSGQLSADVVAELRGDWIASVPPALRLPVTRAL